VSTLKCVYQLGETATSQPGR